MQACVTKGNTQLSIGGVLQRQMTDAGRGARGAMQTQAAQGFVARQGGTASEPNVMIVPSDAASPAPADDQSGMIADASIKI